MWGVGAKAICGVLAVALGDLAAAGTSQTANALTMILSYSDNGLLFPALFLSLGYDEAGWHQSIGRIRSGG